MKMKIAGLVAVIALLAGPAWAQMPQPHTPGPGELDKDKTRSEIESEKETERAYKRSLGNIQEQKAADPWGTVRSESGPPRTSAAKAAPAKPKTPKTAAKPETPARQ
jgi:hypothetical protein